MTSPRSRSLVRVASATVVLGALGALGGCAMNSVPAGTGGASTTTSSVPVWPVAPASWNPNEARRPFSVHMTFQRDPGAAVTVEWQTAYVPKTALTPKVWVVKASEVRGAGADVELPYAPQYERSGAGLNYTFNGTVDYVQWTTEVTGLEPNTKYYYRAGTWESFDPATKTFKGADLSPVHSFTTPPAKGQTTPFRFVLAGDSRDGLDKIEQQIGRLAGLDARFWLFSGDMTAAGSAKEWESWFSAMGPLLHDVPLMPVQGNHELVADLYYNQFAFPKMPGLADALHGYAWSFNAGNIHFIGLNSNTESLVTQQKAWLEADLQAARADAALKYILVMFHHPAYSASTVHGSTLRVQTHWVPLFEKYSVDLVVSGHDHAYERSYPVREGQKAAAGVTGVVYMVAGGFFAPPYTAGKDWWTVTSTDGTDGNYVVVDASEAGLAFKAYTGDGSAVIDSFTLTK